MIAWCWWAAGGCLLLAFAATVLGIVWCARLVTVTDNDNGTGTVHTPDPGWDAAKAPVLLGVRLLFTTLAGLFALLAAPPWLA